MAFDLNEIPAVEEEEEVVMREIQAERSNVQNGNPQGYRTQGAAAVFVGPWRKLSLAEVASLLNLLQVPLPGHRAVHLVVTHRVNGTFEHAWISWLPGRHAFIGGTFLPSSQWARRPTVFRAAPVLATCPLAWRAPRPADVASAFYDPRRPWSSHGGGVQQQGAAIAAQTTMVGSAAGMDQNRGGSEQRERIGDKFISELHHPFSIPGNESMTGVKRSAVRPVKMETGPAPEEDGTRTGVPRVAVPVEVPTALRINCVQNYNTDIGSSQRGAADHHEERGEWNVESENNVGAEILDDHLTNEERRTALTLAIYEGRDDDKFESEIHQRDSIPRKEPMIRVKRSAVRPVRMETGPAPEENGTRQLGVARVPVPVEVPTALRLSCVQNYEADFESSPQGARDREEQGEWNLDSGNDLPAKLLEHLVDMERRKLNYAEDEELRKMRKAAFLAGFNYTTERCNPTAPCSKCMLFFSAPSLPVNLADRASGSGLGASWHSDDAHPPVLKSTDDEDAPHRKEIRHGPKSKSSEFRGVSHYKRSGRWEAHIWHEGMQSYLGAHETKGEAARTYDKAAIMLFGPSVVTNFKPENYQHELSYLYKLNKAQLIMYLCRDSRGFGSQIAYPGVKHVKDVKRPYQATFGPNIIGTFDTEDKAIRVVYKTALQYSYGGMASLILDTHHVRNMPSFADQLFAAIYPEEVEAMVLKTKIRASKRSGKLSYYIRKEYVSPTITWQKPSSEFSAVTPITATASPGRPVEQLPSDQIMDHSPAAKRCRRSSEQHLASKKAHKRTCPLAAAADRHPPARVPPASSSRIVCNTTIPGVARAKAASEHGGHGNVKPPGAQNPNGFEAGHRPCIPPVVKVENQIDELVLPSNTTGGRGPHPPHALATRMAPGVSNVVATRPLGQPEAPKARLPIRFNKYRIPK